jgi:hypothetical protein
MRSTLASAGDIGPRHDRIREAIEIVKERGVGVALTTHARYLCWGMLFGTPSLLSRSDIYTEIIQDVRRRLDDKRISLGAWRGLLQTYFDYDGRPELQEGWLVLRRALQDTLPSLRQSRTIPAWLSVISWNPELLGDAPCQRYAAAVLEGDLTETEPLKTKLQIPESSWFWTELLMSQVRHVVGLSDVSFVNGTKKLVTVLRRHPLSVDEAIAYAACKDTGRQAKPFAPIFSYRAMGNAKSFTTSEVEYRRSAHKEDGSRVDRSRRSERFF